MTKPHFYWYVGLNWRLPVYQIVSDNHLVKSYRSIAESYKGNESLGFILLIAGLVLLMFFLAMDWEIKRDVN